nr:hypothetical protein [Tanacetum cinerariifolium]
LPPCYQAANHQLLRQRLGRLRLVAGEASEFLLSAAGQSITKASLSNIFEYVSPDEFERVSFSLATRPTPLRLVFWNLLQAQATRRTAAVPLLPATSAALGAQDACFFFGGVRVLEYAGSSVAAASSASQPLALSAA